MARERILIVEDEFIVAEDLKASLESKDYRVVGTAATAAAALQLARAERPDLIIMDIVLAGDKNGIDAAEQVRAELRLPVIFLTAYSDDRMVERAKAAQPYGYLLKPFQDRELYAAVETALYKHEMEGRVAHLNAVLLAIRNVNQLIVRAKGAVELVREACTLLTETRGYLGAWIAVGEGQAPPTELAEAGWGDDFAHLAEPLRQGQWPPCLAAALAAPDGLVVREPGTACEGSALTTHYADQRSVTVALRYDEQTLGMLNVVVPEGTVVDEQERDLLREVGDDLAFALHNLRGEERRKQAEELLMATGRMARVGGWELDVATGGVSWSTVARELHEVDEDYQPELDTALDFFHPDDRPRLRAAIDAAMTRGEPYDLEIRFISARGKHLWTQTCCSPVTEGGRVVKLLGTFQDITKRKQLEEQLREALLRQQEAVKAANVGLWDWDLTTGEVRFSAEWKRQIGYEDHEIGTGFDEWQSRVHPDDLPAVLEQVQRAIDEGRSSVQTEFRFRHKDGSYRWILAQSSVLHDEHGKAVRMLGSHVDVTASRHAEEAQASLQEQFRQSQKMESIGRLAGGIAHDFNNLLTIINSYATFAVEDLRPEDPLCADLGQIIDAGERASALTRQLLAFSRRQIMAPEILDLNEVVGDLEKMLVRLIGEDIVLRVTPGADLGLVHTDRAQLEQVIMNLVVNARDAMPDGGKLTIETANVTLDESYVADHPGSRAGPHVMLAVTDTGVGMTAEVKARVFEPFFTTKEQGKGTGLGLAMAYGVVNQSEGTISVYAEPGTGTTFKVYLPLAEGVDKPTRAPAADPMDLHGTETVLVVEDEEGVRTMAARILRSAGYKVILAENAGEALLECERKPDEVQLLLTDVVMPKMSGKELAERLANVVPGLKVLYMSGYTENTIVHHGVLEEGTNFIAKPFNAPALLRSVRITLDAH